HRRFFLPYAAPALWNVTAIVALAGAGTWLVSPALPLDEQLGRLALALAWGTVAGGVLQVAVQLPVCWRLLHGIALRVSTTPAGADRAGVPTDRVFRAAVVLRIRGAGPGARGGAVPDGPVRTGRHAHGGRRLGRVRGGPVGTGDGEALRLGVLRAPRYADARE